MWRRGNWIHGFGQRFGKYDAGLKPSITNRHVIWLHAVSVGEVNVCAQLIRALEPRLPNAKIVVSTTTTTRMGELQRKLSPLISKIFYPIDRRNTWRAHWERFIQRPSFWMKPEIWPDFIWRAQEKGIPLFLVNVRLSERSYRGYKRFGFLFRPLFAAFAGVGAQNEADAARLREVGCRPEAVQMVGNLKFDAAKFDGRRLLNVPAMLRQLGVRENARLLVCGSTHDGEERILADIYIRLRQRFPDLFLVLGTAPFRAQPRSGADVERAWNQVRLPQRNHS